MSYLGEEIKKLGFGLMRLPMKDGTIDIDQTSQMVDMFMDSGFTYFDTAWGYEGSEDAIRKALVERYPRERYVLATKNAAWIKCSTKEEAISQLETSLKRTGAGYIDFYLLHNVGNAHTKIFDDFGMWDWILEMKERGLIRHAGFSFHSTPEELDHLLTIHPQMEFVQLQINYADWDDPSVQSRACYEVARKHGKPVIIMEPVKGGLLSDPPKAVRNVFEKAEPDASPSSWAIRFAASLDGVITVLSGMSSISQMQDNISYMKGFHGMTDDEQTVVCEAREAMRGIEMIPCTSCNYCAEVCPNNIGISGTFAALNNYRTYNNKPSALRKEKALVIKNQKQRADCCVSCGKCEDACPQHLPIRDLLKEACSILIS